MATAERTRARTSHPLRRREFRLYFIGNLTSNVGSWLANVAMAVMMWELTGSNAWVGLIGLGFFLPVLLLALPAGALADRLDRLKLLRVAQTVMFALSVLLTVLAITGDVNRYWLVGVAFGLGAGVALGIPAMQALVPQLVPADELGEAIQMNALTFNVARAIGPVIASATIATIGFAWAFGLNAATFVPLIGALVLIKRPPFQRVSDRPPGPVREGLAYAWRHLSTRWMLLSIVAIGMALDPIFTLSPALVSRLGHASETSGFVIACWGAGAVVTIITGRRAIAFVTEHGLGWVGLVGLFAGVAGLGASPWLPLSFASALIAGAGYITATMAFTTTIQSSVPESLRGRISALWTLAFLGPRGLGAVADGALADAVGAPATTVAFASIALVGALLLRHVQGTWEEPVPPAL